MHISKVYSMLGIFLQVSRDMFERNSFRIWAEFEIEVYLYLDFYNLLTLDRDCTYTIIFHITDQHPYFFQFLDLWNILKSLFQNFVTFLLLAAGQEKLRFYTWNISRNLYIYIWKDSCILFQPNSMALKIDSHQISFSPKAIHERKSKAVTRSPHSLEKKKEIEKPLTLLFSLPSPSKSIRSIFQKS